MVPININLTLRLHNTCHPTGHTVVIKCRSGGLNSITPATYYTVWKIMLGVIPHSLPKFPKSVQLPLVRAEIMPQPLNYVSSALAHLVYLHFSNLNSLITHSHGKFVLAASSAVSSAASPLFKTSKSPSEGPAR